MFIVNDARKEWAVVLLRLHQKCLKIFRKLKCIIIIIITPNTSQMKSHALLVMRRSNFKENKQNYLKRKVHTNRIKTKNRHHHNNNHSLWQCTIHSFTVCLRTLDRFDIYHFCLENYYQMLTFWFAMSSEYFRIIFCLSKISSKMTAWQLSLCWDIYYMLIKIRSQKLIFSCPQAIDV